jgi:hypothetical protein
MRKFDVASWILALSLATALGCAKPVAPEDLADEPGQGDGSGGSSGSNGGTGKTPANTDPTDTLPGVVDETPDGPPGGCLGGFADGSLRIELSGGVDSLRLEASDGELVANDTSCTDADGEDVLISELTYLEIAGGTADEAVTLDFGSGDWSSLLEGTESIRVSLGTGDNTLVIRGTPDADNYFHGMRQDDLVLDLTGSTAIALTARGVTRLGLSLGAGDDHVSDLASLMQAEVDGQAANGNVVTGVRVTQLSIPVVVYGAEGDDWMVGGTGDDEFDGGPGNDEASGLAGNDFYVSGVEGDGTDIFNGGPDYDGFSYARRTADVTVTSCISAAFLMCSSGECSCSDMSGEPGENDRVINVEELTGGAGNDLLRGGEAADSLNGGPGDDLLYGLGGSDLLFGQLGLDTLEGGVDGDYCDGRDDEIVISCEI